MTLFLVEQNANHALKLSDRGYVMVNGQIRLSGSGAGAVKRSGGEKSLSGRGLELALDPAHVQPHQGNNAVG